MPEWSITAPMTALMMSAAETQKNTHTTGSPVKVHRQKAMGRHTAQVYTQSKRKVMKVMPPERMVK